MFLVRRIVFEQFFEEKLTTNVVQIWFESGSKQYVFPEVFCGCDWAVRVTLAEELMSQPLRKQTFPGYCVASMSSSSGMDTFCSKWLLISHWKHWLQCVWGVWRFVFTLTHFHCLKVALLMTIYFWAIANKGHTCCILSAGLETVDRHNAFIPAVFMFQLADPWVSTASLNQYVVGTSKRVEEGNVESKPHGSDAVNACTQMHRIHRL